jgi:iron complex outermembrane receptor protein
MGNPGPFVHTRLLTICVVVLALILTQTTFAQDHSIQGRVTDARSGEGLGYANLVVDGKGGTTADAQGYFNIRLKEGEHTVTASYVGYHTETIRVLAEQSAAPIQIRLSPSITTLEDVVVSASRRAQRLSDISVSMAVLKPDQIANNHSANLEQSLEKVPGVDIIDGQANIRGGSGWSYGAGSRVLVLVDDLPLLSPDAADAKWNFFPMENIGQVEIIKGASSALYGSSALNGVIHVRTAWPGDTPETRLAITGGTWMKPSRDELVWDDDRIPVFGHAQLTHSRRIRNTDLVLSSSLFTDPGFRKDNYHQNARVNLKLRVNDPKGEDHSYGLIASYMQMRLTDFLLWKDAGPGAWQQNPAAITPNEGYRVHVDPFLNLYGSMFRHQFRGRFFRTFNGFPDDPDKDNNASQFMAEYQLSHTLASGTELSAGGSGSYSSSSAALFGSHQLANMALFAQADHKFSRLSASLGARWEAYSLDNERESRPVFRAGINYHLFDFSFLRASYGQGYRYPSIAEKFTFTRVGGVNVFPSPDIRSETGWSAEIGWKQGFRAGGVQGYIDLAAFWTEYQDMMEFSFGFYDTLTYLPTTEYFSLRNMGFQSQNIGNARISGLEAVLTAQGRLGAIGISGMAGYTRIDPRDVSTDSLYRAGKSDPDGILKYRYRHSAQADIELTYKALGLGMACIWHSETEVVDQVFVDPVLGQLILPGYTTYREEHSGEGYLIGQARLEYRVRQGITVSAAVRNIFNRENIGRPGDLKEPRSLSLRASFII